MTFFFAFTLLVLPLFLMVCVQIVKNSEHFGHTIAGKIIVGIFYLFAVLAIGTAVYLVTLI